MKFIKNALAAVRSRWKALGDKTAHLRREYVVEQYLRAGAQFADVLAKLYLGECISIEKSRKRFAQCERRYAALGYRTVALDEFIEYAYGHSIHHLLRIKRDQDEAPVYHADLIEQNYKEGFRPMQDFGGHERDWMRCGLDKPKTAGASGQACDDNDGCRHREKDAKGASDVTESTGGKDAKSGSRASDPKIGDAKAGSDSKELKPGDGQVDPKQNEPNTGKDSNA